MSKWIVIISTESGVLTRMAFEQGTQLQLSMKAVIEASQFWNMTRFSQWVRNAKAGQWIEIRDTKNNVRALVVRSSDPRRWWVG